MPDSTPRLYHAILRQHLTQERQMAFVSGPRQVGKTTICRELSDHYLNWDNSDDRRLLLKGPTALADRLELDRLQEHPPIVTFDELHKFLKWKSFLKGIFDTNGKQMRMIVTGSSRLDVFRRGGDSLMGRYFLYRMHPLSVAEILNTSIPETPLRPPRELSDSDWKCLWEHGGFPEPYLRRDSRFTHRWRSLRRDLLLREDVRDLTQVQDLGSLETLALILAERSGQQLIYSNLAQEVQISVDTCKRWIDLLNRLHYGFLIRPWFQNVTKALRKEPKWFLRDWSGIDDEGQRAETFTACHLLKAVEGWTDLGLGSFELRYLRDKMKREVDFLIVRDRKPWILIEAKTRNTRLSPSLAHFQSATRAPHAFQIVHDLDHVAADPFLSSRPTVVPARTLLSQLL